MSGKSIMSGERENAKTYTLLTFLIYKNHVVRSAINIRTYSNVYKSISKCSTNAEANYIDTLMKLCIVRYIDSKPDKFRSLSTPIKFDHLHTFNTNGRI